MDSEDLVGCEVIAVKKLYNRFVIVFDNGHELEVGGEFEDAIRECE